jgi:hypothetical protein
LSPAGSSAQLVAVRNEPGSSRARASTAASSALPAPCSGGRPDADEGAHLLGRGRPDVAEAERLAAVERDPAVADAETLASGVDRGRLPEVALCAVVQDRRDGVGVSRRRGPELQR